MWVASEDVTDVYVCNVYVVGVHVKKVKGVCTVLHGQSISRSHGTPLVIWDHTVIRLH